MKVRKRKIPLLACWFRKPRVSTFLLHDVTFANSNHGYRGRKMGCRSELLFWCNDACIEGASFCRPVQLHARTLGCPRKPDMDGVFAHEASSIVSGRKYAVPFRKQRAGRVLGHLSRFKSECCTV